ncbi:four helix bundle protein [Zunongwangia endophytica]|uniref:Four helix bundle protein n=1 Tax=Zunongwangia endophytica TaxID=1808945 RepID=A0ABV8H3I1_9FLAO|nr:four helix bundle protein [Zunongwangia endophytica]MDN3595855.1 four helix bundle protein [Zunongwangia endophytica]
MESKKENIILNLSVEFALSIIDYSKTLRVQQHYDIASQLVRSGTSVGANIWEAQSSESRKDFVHKLKVADKEAKEVEYWLLLCKSSIHITNYDISMDDKLLSIQKLLSRIISTNKKKMLFLFTHYHINKSTYQKHVRQKRNSTTNCQRG